jgi:predicted small lipoprotein YifL
MSRIAAALIILSLAACGMKGPLELPPKGNAKDLSTTQSTTTR